MDKEELKKALHLEKADLIEWLMEMYENEKILRQIISKYEEYSNALIKTETSEDHLTGKIHFFEKITTVINGKELKYFRGSNNRGRYEIYNQ